MLRDLAYSIRALRRAPLLLITAVATLAIGIGLTTGVVAVAYGVLLKPLPYADPSQLVAIEIRWAIDSGGDIGVSLDMVDEWRQRARAFTGVAGHSDAEFTIRGAGDPRTARVAMVTDGFFELLGVPAAQGTASGISGVNRSAALSRALAAQIVSRGIGPQTGLTIGAGQFDVAAIMPREFAFPSDEIGAWVGARAVPAVRFLGMADQRRFRLLGRLQPGVTIAQAQDDAARVQSELNAELEEGRRRSALVRPLADQVRGNARASVLPFVAGAGLVLLIACANVSALLAGRSSARRREFAVRRALGGDTAHLLRAALAETLAIAILGWTAGVWLAYLVIRAFLAFGERAIPNLNAVALDPVVLVASMALTVAAAVLTGIAPALRAVRADAGAVLKDASARSGRTASLGRAALVAAQIALTVVLLVAAGLLMRTVASIVEAERGFEWTNTVAMRLMLTETVRFNASDRVPTVDRLVSAARGLPGVVTAGIGSDLPPRGTQIQMTVRVVTENEQKTDTFPLSFAAVTPGYLEAIGATLVEGRLLEERDRTADVPAVVITQSAARRVSPNGKSPLTTEWPVAIPGPDGKRVRPLVVGIIKDVKYGGLERPDAAGVFSTWERLAPSQSYLVVRTTGDPRNVVPAIRTVVRRVDPALPLYPVQSLEEIAAGSIADRRLRLQLAELFAGLSLALAAVALWGAVAQTVHERRRELAIRLALGSTGAGAVRLIVRSSAILIAAGLAAGVLAAALSAQSLRHLLHGIAPLDPLTFAAGAATAAAVSILACYLPARRAASIDPAELLREG